MNALKRLCPLPVPSRSKQPTTIRPLVIDATLGGGRVVVLAHSIYRRTLAPPFVSNSNESLAVANGKLSRTAAVSAAAGGRVIELGQKALLSVSATQFPRLRLPYMRWPERLGAGNEHLFGRVTNPSEPGTARELITECDNGPRGASLHMYKTKSPFGPSDEWGCIGQLNPQGPHPILRRTSMGGLCGLRLHGPLKSQDAVPCIIRRSLLWTTCLQLNTRVNRCRVCVCVCVC